MCCATLEDLMVDLMALGEDLHHELGCDKSSY
jgi:hypothetical protein